MAEAKITGCKNISKIDILDKNTIHAKNWGIKIKLKKEVHDLFNNPQSLAEAKITGCKNISKIDILDKNTIHAKNWGIKIKLKKDIGSNVKYMGIRAHHISIEDNSNEECYYLTVKNVIENPFSYSVYVINEEDKTFNEIHIEVNKDIKPINIGDKILIK